MIDLNEWFQFFRQEIQNQHPKQSDFTDGERTVFVREIIHNQMLQQFAQELSCVCLSSEEEVENKEYLGIDVTWIDPSPWSALPELIIELENDTGLWYLQYCSWKLMCVRCERKILICYVGNERMNELVEKLNQNLQIQKDSLFLLIVGTKDLTQFTGYLKSGAENFQLLK